MAKSMGKAWRKYGKIMADTSKAWPIYGIVIPIPHFEKSSPYPYIKFLKIFNSGLTLCFLINQNSFRNVNVKCCLPLFVVNIILLELVWVVNNLFIELPLQLVSHNTEYHTVGLIFIF